jgi:protein TonB
MTPPVPLSKPDPEYPRLAMRRGEEGSVLCHIHVDAGGGVTRVEIERSSGHPRLDDAARVALATWRFRPCTIDGAPAASIYRHRVRFELGG